MCNNNGHCRKFDAGTMCPSYRVTRDEQHLTRGRANTLRLALSGQLEGVDAAEPLASDAVQRGAGSVRRLQGLQARLPDRRRHGADEDRGDGAAQGGARLRPARSLPRRACRDWPGWRVALPWLPNLRNRVGLLRRLGERWLGLSARRSLPAWRRDTFDRVAPTLGLASRRRGARRRQGGGAVRRHLQRQLRDRERGRRGARAAGRGLRRARRTRRGRRRALLRPHPARRRHAGGGPGAGVGSCSPPCCRSPSAASPSSASSRRAC